MTYIDSEEISVRIAEACLSNRRPVGTTAHEAMQQLEAIDAESARGFRRAALAAAEYIAECCNANHPGSVEIKTVTVESVAKQ